MKPCTSLDCLMLPRGIHKVPTMVSQISPLFHTSTVRPRSSRFISLFARRNRKRNELGTIGKQAAHYTERFQGKRTLCHWELHLNPVMDMHCDSICWGKWVIQDQDGSSRWSSTRPTSETGERDTGRTAAEAAVYDSTWQSGHMPDARCIHRACNAPTRLTGRLTQDGRGRDIKEVACHHRREGVIVTWTKE